MGPSEPAGRRCGGTADGAGYWLVTSNGQVMAFGDASNSALYPCPSRPVVALMPTPDGRGYWIATSSGAVFNFGDAETYSLASGRTRRPGHRRHGRLPEGGGYSRRRHGQDRASYGDAPTWRTPPACCLARPASAVNPSGTGAWLASRTARDQPRHGRPCGSCRPRRHLRTCPIAGLPAGPEHALLRPRPVQRPGRLARRGPLLRLGLRDHLVQPIVDLATPDRRATGSSGPTPACSLTATPHTKAMPGARTRPGRCPPRRRHRTAAATGSSPRSATCWFRGRQELRPGQPRRWPAAGRDRPTADGKGYWIATSTGAVFPFGDAGICLGRAWHRRASESSRWP